MKRIILILLVSCGILTLRAQDAGEILEQSRHLSDQGKYSEAVNLLQNYLVSSDKNDPYYTVALLHLGSVYMSMNDYKKAEHCYLEQKNIAEKIFDKNDRRYANSLSALGTLYSAIGDNVKAEYYFTEEKNIAEKVSGKESHDYASSLSRLGFLYLSMGNYAKAESVFLEAKNINKKIAGENSSDYANSLGALGSFYISAGDYSGAEACYSEATNIWEKVSGKESWFYANSLELLGSLHKIEGDFSKAETYFLEAKNIVARTSDKESWNYANSLNHLGALYASSGDYLKAEVYYSEAADIHKKIYGENHIQYAFALHISGTAYLGMNDYAKAEACFSKAVAIGKKTSGKEHPHYATLLQGLGMLYQYKGDDAKAESAFSEAASIYEKISGKTHPDYERSLNFLFGSYMAGKKYPKAITVRKELDQITVSKTEKNFTFMSESQRSAFWDQNKNNFEYGYSLTQAYPVTAAVALAYDNALFTKGLLLRTTNGIRDAVYSSNDSTLIRQYDRLKNLRQQLSILQSKEISDKNFIKTLEIAADSLDKALTSASETYRDTKVDISVKWKDIQANLRSDEIAVEFIRFRYCDEFRYYRENSHSDSILYCALVLKKDSKAPVWIPLCDEKQLQTLTERIGDIQEYTQALYADTKDAELYRLIWQPLEKELKDVRTVYYSPSGMLHQIAFAALSSGNATLSDKYDLRLVSSTREIVRLKKEKSGILPQGTAVVYGGLWYDADKDRLIAEAKKPNNPTLTLPQGEETRLITIADVLPKNQKRGQSWDYLEGTETEAKQICGSLKERNIPNRLYTETAGNEESFKRLSGTSTGIIHLATHGFFLEDVEDESNRDMMRTLGGNNRKAFENPLLRSGLLMAGANRTWTGEDIIEDIEDGILTADEIARMNLIKTRLVVLSACETGLGETKNAEGVFGLQRAFKLAGAETLVMSLWTVPDEATSELMSTFYKFWLSGKTKHEAFASAQKLVREKYKEPFYWAGFVMMD